MKQAYRFLLLASVIALLLGTAAACGSRVYKAPMKGAVPLEPKAYTFQDTLSELDALEKPEGVKANVWDELKGALREALESRARTNDGSAAVSAVINGSEVGGRDTRPTDRIVSSPPTGAANKVNDLTATRETNGDFTLSWHYRNLGDYDQNGVVGVSDITPLAMHYNETYDPETQPDCIQAVIDGSGNGKVGVEDVTQLAQYFGNEFAVYEMQGSDQQQGPFAHTNTVQPPAEGRSDARLAFTFGLSSQPPYTYWRVVPLDGANNPGESSNVVALNVEAPVRVLGVTPLQGLAGAVLTFTAFVAGTGPFTFEWNFGDGATPNISTAAQPTVTLSMSEGPHPAQVKVTGAAGSVTYHFTLMVTPTPGNPPVINSVGPFSGLSGEQLNFSADVTGDEPLTYSWEFDGGASPPVSAEAAPTAILSRGGTLPEPAKDYPCRLTVTNDFGTAVQDFILTVSAWWHIIAGPETRGPEAYEFTHAGKLTGLARGPSSGGLGSPSPLYYCSWNGIQWNSEYVATEVWGQIRLGHDSQDNPVICSLGSVLKAGVMYISKANGSWLVEHVNNDAIVSADFVGPIFYADNTPLIIYAESASLKAARKTGGDWVLESLVDEGRVTTCFATMNSLGEPQVACTVENAPSYKALFLHEDEGEWISETVYEGTRNELGSLALNTSDSPTIALGLMDEGTYFLEKAGESWNSEFVNDYLVGYRTHLVTAEDIPVFAQLPYQQEEVIITFWDGLAWQSSLLPLSPISTLSSGGIIAGDKSQLAVSFWATESGPPYSHVAMWW